MDSPASVKHPATERGTKWIDRIRAAGEREVEFTKQATRAEAIYMNSDKGADKKYFNILHSNVETIVPAIYSATPKPDIRRRFNDSTGLTDPQDPMAQQGLMMDKVYRDAASMIERAIIVQTDDGALDMEMEALAGASFTAGRGIIRVRLLEEDAASGEIDDDVTEDALSTAVNEEAESSTEVEDEEADPEALAEKQNTVQRIGFEAVSWRDFRQGPAKRWQDVPWVAFKHLIPEETIKEWSKDEGVKAQLRALPPATSDGEEDTSSDTAVWEVWCKSSKTVKFIRESDGVIFKTVKDPLGLTAFFPCARPIQPIERIGDLCPVCPYSIYEELAEELDLVTRRIRKIIAGIKVRGGAAAGDMIKGIKDIAGLGDNEIAEITGVEAFAQQGGLEKGITWWPIEKSIQALEALSVHRESIKATIYEVTGISDIVRGASNAQETARAQEIKSQWGSLRIQKMQRLMERCVREVFVMAAELIAEKFTPQTLTAITGIEYSAEIDAVFKSRVARVYRIDVETDSTIKSDMSKSKQEMAEFLNGTATYFQAMAPMAQQGMMDPALMSEIYTSFARTFRLGKQAEDALEQAAAKAKQGPPPIPSEVQQQMQQMQEELAKLQEENQSLKADKSAEMQKAQLDGQVKVAVAQQDMGLKREEHQFKMATEAQKHQMNMAAMEQKNVMDIRGAQQKQELAAKSAKLKAFSMVK
jgi:hypothetical protein